MNNLPAKNFFIASKYLEALMKTINYRKYLDHYIFPPSIALNHSILQYVFTHCNLFSVVGHGIANTITPLVETSGVIVLVTENKGFNQTTSKQFKTTVIVPMVCYGNTFSLFFLSLFYFFLTPLVPIWRCILFSNVPILSQFPTFRPHTCARCVFLLYFTSWVEA